MKLKLLLDEDIHYQLTRALRNRGYDVVHAQEVDRKGKSDEDQLNFAISQERCIVSFNVKDFILLHNKFFINHIDHNGIIISKHLPISEIFYKLLKLLQSNSLESFKNRIEFL